MNGIDTAVMSWILSIRNPALDSIMLGITYLVDYLVIMLIAFLLLFLRQRRLVLTMTITLAIELFVTFGIKELVQRPRPTVLPLDVSDFSFYSFPSGHTSRAFVLAGIFSAAWKKQRWLFYGLAGLVGFSRIYLGVHYFTDVVAGAVLGIMIFWAIAKYQVVERIVGKHHVLKKKRKARTKTAGKKSKPPKPGK
jgi:undecaprenyl-diphosphatase